MKMLKLGRIYLISVWHFTIRSCILPEWVS
jgi:hypothetical protein